MDIEKIKEELKRDEGFRMYPYKCTADKLTIGYGRNIEDRGISESEAELLLYNDIQDCYNWLAVNYDWFTSLSEARQRALINLTFNVGFAGFTKFKKMIRALAIGHYDRAAIEMMDSRWYYQVGDRAKRVIELMRTG